MKSTENRSCRKCGGVIKKGSSVVVVIDTVSKFPGCGDYHPECWHVPFTKEELKELGFTDQEIKKKKK